MSGPEQTLAAVTYLVADYDEAIDWFTRALGFDLLSDQDLGDDKRWVEIRAGETTRLHRDTLKAIAETPLRRE